MMLNMQRPFVIHTHSRHGKLHYDLMLSHGEVLATWKLLRSPVGMTIGQAIPARKLPDHRTAYLTYQGAVSGGRGEVTRLDKGSFELRVELPGRWRFRLHGHQVSGSYELVHDAQDTDAWTFCRLPDD